MNSDKDQFLPKEDYGEEYEFQQQARKNIWKLEKFSQEQMENIRTKLEFGENDHKINFLPFLLVILVICVVGFWLKAMAFSYLNYSIGLLYFDDTMDESMWELYKPKDIKLDTKDDEPANIKLTLQCRDLISQYLTEVNPVCKIYCLNDEQVWIYVGETETQFNTTNPVFDAHLLFNYKYEKTTMMIRIVIDNVQADRNETLGTLETTLSQIISDPSFSQDISNISSHSSIMIQTSIVDNITDCSDQCQNPFLFNNGFTKLQQVESPTQIIPSFLQKGGKTDIIVVMDFTSSNTDQKLHDILVKQKNDYEKATELISKVIVQYESDKRCSVYGFGAIRNYERYMGRNDAFPLNRNDRHPQVDCDTMLDIYKRELPFLTLNGGTFIVPVLTKIMDEIQRTPNPLIYYNVIILTDGLIDDEPAALNLIRKSTRLPMSLIFVGLGNADFGRMVNLDNASSLSLNAAEEKVESRDNVQFFKFNDIKTKEQNLAEEALKKIPAQILEYLDMMNISL